MSRSRTLQARISQAPPAETETAVEPFASAEAAWFWYMQCQIARLEGARFSSGLGTERPCEPMDIYRAVVRLHRGRILTQAHLTVLADFGRALTPPDPRRPDQIGKTRLWSEALSRLAEALRAKGIVR